MAFRYSIVVLASLLSPLATVGCDKPPPTSEPTCVYENAKFSVGSTRCQKTSTGGTTFSCAKGASGPEWVAKGSACTP